RQPDMRMRSNINRSRNALWEVNRTHMIEEYEGANHTALRAGEDATDLKTSEVAPPLVQDEIDHGLFTAISERRTQPSPICARSQSCSSKTPRSSAEERIVEKLHVECDNYGRDEPGQ